MMPDACMVSNVPLDAHAHILPRAATVNPMLPTALVSLGVGLIHTHTYIPAHFGVREGETDAELCLCPNVFGIRPESQGDMAIN